MRVIELTAHDDERNADVRIECHEQRRHIEASKLIRFSNHRLTTETS
jgi:hypothetical protein